MPRGTPFLAFWLRTSVVIVLISLISERRLIEPYDINPSWVRCSSDSLLSELASVALVLHYFLDMRNPPFGDPNNTNMIDI